MLRVLIADDSAVTRELLANLVNDDPEMMVAGMAGGGRETVKKAADLRPDLITMDFLMPDMDGVEATRQIMARSPVPIVLISSAITPGLAPTHFDALAVGAVDVMEKPDLHLLRGDAGLRRRFLERLKAMSAVVTVTRRSQSQRPGRARSSSSPAHARKSSKPPSRVPAEAELLVLGASTGGPPAIVKALGNLPGMGSPPAILVQHMAPGFIGGFVDWLNGQLGPRVCLATSGERVTPGNVYVAPDDHHVEVTGFGRLLVYQAPPLRFHRPSVDVLFQSAAKHYGAASVGVLLTGMGDDGARGLGAMRRSGAFTVAENETSAVVYGMPGAATARGAVAWSASATAIGEALRGLRYPAQLRAGGEC